MPQHNFYRTSCSRQTGLGIAVLSCLILLGNIALYKREEVDQKVNMLRYIASNNTWSRHNWVPRPKQQRQSMDTAGSNITTTKSTKANNVISKKSVTVSPKVKVSTVLTTIRSPTTPLPPTTTVTVKDSPWGCAIPKLDINDPEVSKFYGGKPRPLLCDPDVNWVYADNGKFIISKAAEKKHGKITCNYMEISRVPKNDDEVTQGEAIPHMKNASTLVSDFFRASCKSSDGSTWENIIAGIAPKPEVLRRRKAPFSPNAMGLNVFVFGFDSISHMNFVRQFKATSKYLTEDLGGITMDGFNILGDGTTPQLLAMLAGKAQEELPEARRRGVKNASTVDGYPWIWKKFKANGYVTQYGEGTVKSAAFNLRLTGFSDQPVDHYLRPFYIQVDVDKMLPRNKMYCLGNVTRHKMMMDWSRQLYKAYPKERRKFSFFWHEDYTHPATSYIRIQWADDDMKDLLQWLEEEGHLNNTLLIVMSDHGHRNNFARATTQGRFEELLPYLTLRFPPWFVAKYPKEIRNVKTNVGRLVTTFDLHELLVDILDYKPKPQKPDVRKERGISLFREIPKERTCEDATIAIHWCPCITWQSLSVTDATVVQAAQQFASFINNITSKFRDLCAELKLEKVLGTKFAKSEGHALRYKLRQTTQKPNYDDHYRLADTIYQITIQTQPSGAIYETTVTRSSSTRKYNFNDYTISRINVYGDQPHCIARARPDMRPFCYCKVQLR